MDLAIEDDQLALAIGRNGQNVRLASQLTGWHLNVISYSQSLEKKQQDLKTLETTLAEKLNIDTDIATILVTEGFLNVDDVHLAELEMLEKN